MHEGSKRRRGDRDEGGRIYIIGQSLSPSAHVFIIFPSSYLMLIYLLDTDVPSSNNLAFSNNIAPDPQSHLRKTGHMCWRDCRRVHLYLYDFSVRLHELTWAFAAPGELTRRLPPDPVDSDRPALSWYACLVALTWERQKSMRSGRSTGTERTAGNEWLWWLGSSCWPQYRTPSSQSHPPPWPWPWLWLPHGQVIWLRSECVSVGEVSPPGRVWSVSCWGWLRERTGQKMRDVEGMEEERKVDLIEKLQKCESCESRQTTKRWSLRTWKLSQNSRRDSKEGTQRKGIILERKKQWLKRNRFCGGVISAGPYATYRAHADGMTAGKVG